MSVLLANSVDFDVLHVIDVYELLVDIGAICARMTQIRVYLTRFVADLLPILESSQRL